MGNDHETFDSGAPLVVPAAENSLTQELKDYLNGMGADLVGVGSIDRFRGVPEIFDPRRYLPDTRALISIALHVNEAACDLVARCAAEHEVPPSYHSHQMFTLSIVNPQLDEMAFQAARLLEQRGYRAYPFPANMPHVLKPSSKYPGGPGDISHKHVAVACGLGRIGWHSMLITPQFGTRQKLTSLATNAPLL
jgi:epoxyqueuosine reductase QueG